MTESQDLKNKNSSFRPTSAFKDLITIAVVTITVFVLSYFFSLLYFLVELFQKYPRWITYIDEIVTVLLTLVIGFGIFSWRRWRELKEETAKRLELQEELIRCANTRAETERIIARQLQAEIEHRRQAEKKGIFFGHKDK